METIKQINIKNRTYCFYNDIINLDEFDESKIKVDKKDFNDIDIYYLGYEHKKKNSECNVINSVNPLYLRNINMNGQFEKGKDDAWCLLIFYKDDVYEKLMNYFKSIKKKTAEKTWDVVEYDNDYMKIKFESNNIFPTNKDVDIQILTQVGKYYPQLFLDDGLYKNVRVRKN